MNGKRTRPRRRTRRGNTIVLVVGILVLLVIIATSYVTRTHAGRITAVSQQRAALRDDNARVIAESIADEISGALFVRPLEAVPPVGVASSNARRLSPRPELDGVAPDYLPSRYDVDPRDNFGGLPDGQPDIPYNFAPYHVTPFTNWPDGVIWPTIAGTLLLPEGNPIGNPGYGDTRWLADTEPVRLLLPSGQFVFSHWRHMTNLSRPGNGWRICRDISDVGNQTGVAGFPGIGGVVLNLGLPVEQFIWAPGDSHQPFSGSGLPSVLPLTANTFEQRWFNWLYPLNEPFAATLPGYPAAYLDETWIPPNFLNLRDLDGDDIAHSAFTFNSVFDFQDRPESEFVRGSARHTVGRYLADTDGDGFTDAFWFLAPTMTERGIRQIAAVRIVDNSAMLNANVATRFAPVDILNQAYRTRGQTPADLALVGGLAASFPFFWNVGFYDNPDHVSNTLGDPLGLWTRHLQAVGLWKYTSEPLLADQYTPNQFWRADYWRRQGSYPIGADPQSPYTPFGIPDEIELRMFHGNNYPWIFSRLEGTTEIDAQNRGALRGTVYDRGSNEVLEQLRNTDLLDDSRRKLTLYSGARNDLMPAWLWPTLLLTDRNEDNVIDDLDRRQYRAEMLKYDLRQSYYTTEDTNGDGFANDVVLRDVDRDGEPGELTFGAILDDPTDDDINFDQVVNEADHLARMRDYLDRALVIRDPLTGEPIDTYFGHTDDVTDLDLERAERMAAAMAANINAYRDADPDVFLTEAVPLRFYDRTSSRVLTDKTVRYLGLETQPFLVEAAIVHVHGGVPITLRHPGLPDPVDGPRSVVCYTGAGDANESTIVAVQIANPFDRQIDLVDAGGVSNFRLKVFGQTLDLTGQLPADQEWTYLSMDISGDPIDVTAWRTVLDLDTLTPGTDLFDVPAATWSRDRSFYDGNNDNIAVELWRRVDPVSDTWVVVDRIDVRPGGTEPASDPGWANCEYRKFGQVVSQLFTDSIDPLTINTANCVEPAQDVLWPEVFLIGLDGTHWAQWARASRPWAINPAGDDADELNPRYVFGRAAVNAKGKLGVPFTTPDSLHDAFGGSDGTGKLAHFGSRNKHLCEGNFGPDIVNVELDFAMQMLQKDGEFEQVGELLNIWMFGHEIETDLAGNCPTGECITTATFSEWLWEEMFDDSYGYMNDDERRAVNRLHAVPVDNGIRKTGAIMGVGDPLDLMDPLHAIPDLPATARVMEAFVCDGHGAALLADIDGDGNLYEDAQVLSLKLADAFRGGLTPGLINVNTATPEVMRSLPHMARIVGLDPSVTTVSDATRVHVPEAIAGYRDRTLQQFQPDYRERDPIAADLRADRGIASIGELLLMHEIPLGVPPGYPDPAAYPESFRIDFAGRDPFQFTPEQSTRLSTDVVDDGLPGFQTVDVVAQDVEEANLLFSGMSNMITTRSDVFTVYFKIRSFTQNPVTGRWDATDPEHIVDDSRYVMLVDRSEVNVPTDKPKIVYLEKLPK